MDTSTKTKITLQVLATALALPLATIPARADIQTSQEMRVDGQLISTIITSKTAGAERVETTMSLGPMQQKTLTLALCDKKEIYTLDAALKMYSVAPLVEAPTEANDGGKKKGSITTTLVSLKDLGEETIGDYKTRCYEATIRTQLAGCAGEGDITTTQQMCIAPDQDADGGGCDLVAAGATGADDNCNPAIVRKGDWSAYDKLAKNLTVRLRILGAPRGADGVPSQVETMLKKVSRAKLPASLFAIPQGFRKVSAQELQQAQVRAMMQDIAAKQAAAGAQDR